VAHPPERRIERIDVEMNCSKIAVVAAKSDAK